MMTGMKYMRCCRWAGILALVLIVVSGCSAIPRSEPPSYGEWRSGSGVPVDRISFSNLIDWQPLDRDWLLLRFNGGKSFAIRPRDPCMGDVREARTLELLSAMPNLLHRSDRLRLDDNVCLLEEIRSMPSRAGDGAARGSAYLYGGRSPDPRDADPYHSGGT